MLLIAIVLFLVPSNLFLNLSDQFAYVNGIRVDYLILKLYLNELVAWLLIGWFFLNQFFYHGRPQISLANFSPWGRVVIWLLMTLAGLQFFSVLPVVSWWELLKLIQLGLLVWVLANSSSFFKSSWWPTTLIATILFQSSLGIYQFLTQTSFGSFIFLGETNMQSYSGLAKGSFNYLEKTLPYGTTAHPNLLGGVLAIYLTMLWWSLKDKSGSSFKLIAIITSFLGLAALFLTQSVSAWLTMLVGSLLVFNDRQILGLVRRFSWQFLIAILAAQVAVIFILPMVNPASSLLSFTRRIELNQATLAMIPHRPQGFGLGTITTQIEQFSRSREIVRFIQPTHHTGLLWLAETGIVGVVLVLVSLFYLDRMSKKTLTAVIMVALWLLPILLLDHYLLTIESGKLLLAITIGFIMQKTSGLMAKD